MYIGPPNCNSPLGSEPSLRSDLAVPPVFYRAVDAVYARLVLDTAPGHLLDVFQHPGGDVGGEQGSYGVFCVDVRAIANENQQVLALLQS